MPRSAFANRQADELAEAAAAAAAAERSAQLQQGASGIEVDLAAGVAEGLLAMADVDAPAPAVAKNNRQDVLYSLLDVCLPLH